MPIIGGTPEQVEARADAARKKYGEKTITEILDRIIIWTLIGYMAIVFCVLLMFFSPIDDRVLTSVLLVFVLVEMLTEYALWMFTYQGMRRTEAPLADLQKFSSLTKEGWRRAELLMDLTTPVFAGLEGLRERLFPDWRNRKDEKEAVKQMEGMEPITAKDILQGLEHVTQSINSMNRRLVSVENSHMREKPNTPRSARWGTEHLD